MSNIFSHEQQKAAGNEQITVKVPKFMLILHRQQLHEQETDSASCSLLTVINDSCSDDVTAALDLHAFYSKASK